MKTKMKKVSLIAGLGIASILPIASLISCGGRGIIGSDIKRYDTENDNKLIIAHTFSASGPQTKALNKIVDVYNKWVDKDNRLSKGYMKFGTTQNVSGGYGSAIANIRKKFTAQDKKTIANLVVDYPGSAAIINSYKMQYDFRDFLSDSEETTLKNRFQKEFWDQNEKIGGMAKDGFWTIPISVSSMANAVNTPLLAYVIQEVKRLNPSAVDPDKSTEINKLLTEGQKSGDLTYITKKWGQMKSANISFENNSVNDDIFSNWDSLINFAIKAQKGFGIKVDDPRSLHLLAFDSPTNIVQMLSYAYANGDMNKFYIVKNPDTGYVDFKFLEDKNSDNYKNFIKGVELLRKGVASGALWIGGKGAYGSSLLINHEAMISLGSTAGATHWYTGNDGSWSIKGPLGASFSAFYDKTGTSTESKQIYFEGQSKTETISNTFFGKYKNKVLLNNAQKPGKYDLVLKANINLQQFKDKFVSDDFKELISTKDSSIQTQLSQDKANVLEIGSSQAKGKFYVVKETYTPKLATYDKKPIILEGFYKSSTDRNIYFKGETTTTTYTKTELVSGSYKNKVLPYSDKNEASKYDLVLKQGLTDTQLKTLLDTKKYEFIIYIPNDNEDPNKKFIDNNGSYLEKIGSKFVDKEEQKGGFYAVKNNPSTPNVKIVEKHSAEESLQQGEVKGIQAPVKVSGEQNGAVYFQGPSLIPVHANEKEDKALAKFVMWFTGSEKSVFKDDDDNKYITASPITPLQYWLAKAQYIAPLKDAFKDGSDADNAIKAGLGGKSSKYWQGPEIAFDSMKKTFTPRSKIKVLIQPVDDFTAIARNSVTDIVIKGIYTNAHVKGTVDSIDKIYNDLITYAKRKNVVS